MCKQLEMLDADGIHTRVSVEGTGSPLLMFSPGGFDATLSKWTELGIYKKINLMGFLKNYFTCILFDRRECGMSGGRLEILNFTKMANHGLAVTKELGYKTVHVIGGCLGCAPAMEFARLYPSITQSLNLIWPVGGARYRIRNFGRFAGHLSWVANYGLENLIQRALASSDGFAKDSSLGPWGGSLRNDPKLLTAIRSIDEVAYTVLVQASYRQMFDCESALGPKPEELFQISTPTCIIPGDDESHARSAAHFVNECISGTQFLDLPTAVQTSDSVFTFFNKFYNH